MDIFTVLGKLVLAFGIDQFLAKKGLAQRQTLAIQQPLIMVGLSQNAESMTSNMGRFHVGEPRIGWLSQ